MSCYIGDLDMPSVSLHVLAATGEEVTGRCVVLTTGTFLRGRINIG